jgi:hypothetical protein
MMTIAKTMVVMRSKKLIMKKKTNHSMPLPKHSSNHLTSTVFDLHNFLEKRATAANLGPSMLRGGQGNPNFKGAKPDAGFAARGIVVKERANVIDHERTREQEDRAKDLREIIDLELVEFSNMLEINPVS